MAVTTARLAADTLRILPRERLSRMLGSLADLRGPSPLLRQAIRTFIRVYDVDMSDYVVPEGGFESFNHFFTRELRPGARRLEPDPRTVVSPADGRIEDLGPIEGAATLRVKGRPYRVAELLGSEEEAAGYEGGQYFIVYLSPRDYHRVHAPVTGPVRMLRHVPGTLFPVNTIGTEYVPRLFARNERVALFQESETYGTVGVILVGAMGVGRIGLSFDDLLTNTGQVGGERRYGVGAPELERGEELGVFNLGSTVIVFVGPRVKLRFCKQAGDVVRMGEAVARQVEG